MKHYVISATLVIIILALQASAISRSFAQQGFIIETTTLQIYRDGLATLKQTLDVEELYPQITIPILSPSIENIIVLDQNQRAVDYEINEQNLTVFSLGATHISLEYDTFALTNKDAEVWSIIVDIQYEVLISLPKNSTVVYLSEMPTAIDTQENVITFTLYPNQWEVSYLLSPSSTEDSSNGQTDNLIPIEYLIIILGILILIFILILFFKRKRKTNIKKIFKTYPQLSMEDKAVIEFLAENEGRAFEAEIRVKFPDLPRTSLWRLVRRLERMEIVEINKIGLENQVRLK
jgi:uncharacterized membrane protein